MNALGAKFSAFGLIFARILKVCNILVSDKTFLELCVLVKIDLNL